jgi:hypothetical protein
MVDRLAELLELDAQQLQLSAGYLTTALWSRLLSEVRSEELEIAEPVATYSTEAWEPIIEAGQYELVQGDCFDWMRRRPENSIHAIVTDPPYGLKEYSDRERKKLRAGRGGVWRIPPKIGGHVRSPLPRFTVLTRADIDRLRAFFGEWGRLAVRILVPGAHVFVATNPLVSHHLYGALEAAGFEKRGEVIRLVQTLRGGDRPKNAHEEPGNLGDCSASPAKGVCKTTSEGGELVACAGYLRPNHSATSSAVLPPDPGRERLPLTLP